MIHTRAMMTLFTALLFAGCAPKTQTTLTPPPPPAATQPTVNQDVRERVKELTALAKEYGDVTAALPGRDEAEDRAQTAHAFGLLSQLLPMLNGPDMTGDLRQQLDIVSATRAHLAGGSQDLAIEPAVDTGLRAARRALVSIAQRSFTEMTAVTKHLDEMHLKIDALDGMSGPLHRQVAAQALQASAQAVEQMAGALDQRLNGGKK